MASKINNIHNIDIKNKNENIDEDFTEFVDTSSHQNKVSEAPKSNTIYQKYNVFDEISETSNLQNICPIDNHNLNNKKLELGKKK